MSPAIPHEIRSTRFVVAGITRGQITRIPWALQLWYLFSPIVFWGKTHFHDSDFACATEDVISSGECTAVSVITLKCSAYLMTAGIHFQCICIFFISA